MYSVVTCATCIMTAYLPKLSPSPVNKGISWVRISALKVKVKVKVSLFVT